MNLLKLNSFHQNHQYQATVTAIQKKMNPCILNIDYEEKVAPVKNAVKGLFIKKNN